mmetsp:Transcript_30491/g.46731  ORF Transcript_30491/g.46731 Transcript_30491/m.46731 type:complete len:105 (-) Transcript_30491:797-1111(-)
MMVRRALQAEVQIEIICRVGSAAPTYLLPSKSDLPRAKMAGRVKQGRILVHRVPPKSKDVLRRDASPKAQPVDFRDCLGLHRLRIIEPFLLQEIEDEFGCLRPR